jgi:lambda family phage minor tail protein L|tara:strand:+ start:672 stop:1283 length:612 start_codon:yes stop_codon:yes gene_type:complete
MAIPFAELNKINPSSVIELFELELTVGLHIPAGNPNNLDTVFRFHAGANLNNFGQIRFNNNDYQRVAVKAEGFEDTSKGTIPRPTLTFSNLGGITKDTTVMTMSDFLNVVNTVTAGNDLLNAKVTRLLPLASALDNANFVGDNPFGTPSTDRLQDRIYYIDRKAVENRQIVQFELVSRLDMQNKKIPARIVTRDLFPAAGTFI